MFSYKNYSQAFLKNFPLQIYIKFYYKIVLVLVGELQDNQQLVDRFTDLLKRNFHDNVIILIKNTISAQVFTANAYKNNTLERHSNVTSMKTIFYDKTENLNQFNLFLNYRNDREYNYKNKEKVARHYKKMFCDKINASCDLRTRFNHYTHINLKFNLDEISLISNPIMSFSYPIMFHNLCVLVPKGQVLSSLWAMLNAVQYNLLICIVIIIILSGILWYYIVKGSDNQKPILKIYFLLYGILITNSVNSRLSSVTERIFGLSFIIGSFYLVFGYNCKLTSLLVVPQYEKDIDAFKDLVAKNKTIIHPPQIQGSYIPFDITINNYTNQQYEYETNSSQDQYGVFLSFTNDKRWVQMVDCAAAKAFHSSHANFKNGIMQYHIMKEQCSFQLKSMYASFRSPLIKKIDIINSRIIESGIWNHWENENKSFDPSVSRIDTSGFLQSGTILEFWLVLLFGYVLSTFVFFGEIIINRVNNRLK